MKVEWGINFIGRRQKWLITDYMALRLDVEYAYVFPVVVGAIPSENSLGLTGGNR